MPNPTMDYPTLLQFFPERLQELILDPTISDVLINADGKIFIDRAGTLIRVHDAHINSDHLIMAIQNVARLIGKDIDIETPILEGRLPDGSRISAVYSNGRMTVAIRKFVRWFTTDELIAGGSLTPAVSVPVIKALVGGGGRAANVLISGGTGAGKSTLAKSFLDHVPNSERMIVIENPRELALIQDNAERWETVEAGVGRGEMSIATLLTAALRSRPDRIVIGEVREPAAAYSLLQALNTGHSGTLSTIHANNASEALQRLSDLALASSSNLTQGFVQQQVARSIDCVVHISRVNGHRQVTQCGFMADPEKMTLRMIYDVEPKRKVN
jgi:pilus assembly protein CpaF